MVSWYGLNDPQIHVTFEWNMHKAEEYLERKKRETKLPLAWAHFIGFCASRAIYNQPDFNGRLSFGNVNLLATLVLSKGATEHVFHNDYGQRNKGDNDRMWDW